MLIDHCRSRTANAILFFAARTRQCTPTKLMHLLYLLDFGHFKATGRSVTESTYCALDSGPAPAALYWELTRPPGTASFLDDLVLPQNPTEPDSVLLPQAGFVDDDFTRRQLELMEAIVGEFGSDSTDALTSAVCAAGGPWHTAFHASQGNMSAIDYKLILKGLPNRDAILENAWEHRVFRRSFQ